MPPTNPPTKERRLHMVDLKKPETQAEGSTVPQDAGDVLTDKWKIEVYDEWKDCLSRIKKAQKKQKALSEEQAKDKEATQDKALIIQLQLDRLATKIVESTEHASRLRSHLSDEDVETLDKKYAGNYVKVNGVFVTDPLVSVMDFSLSVLKLILQFIACACITFLVFAVIAILTHFVHMQVSGFALLLVVALGILIGRATKD
jgi:membrane-bound ClpP family serine protease